MSKVGFADSEAANKENPETLMFLFGIHFKASGYLPQLDHHLLKESSHLNLKNLYGLPSPSIANKVSLSVKFSVDTTASF